MYIALAIGGAPLALAVIPTSEIAGLSVAENGGTWTLRGETNPTGTIVHDRNPSHELSVMGVFDSENISHLRVLLRASQTFTTLTPREEKPRGINFASILR